MLKYRRFVSLFLVLFALTASAAETWLEDDKAEAFFRSYKPLTQEAQDGFTQALAVEDERRLGRLLFLAQSHTPRLSVNEGTRTERDARRAIELWAVRLYLPAKLSPLKGYLAQERLRGLLHKYYTSEKADKLTYVLADEEIAHLMMGLKDSIENPRLKEEHPEWYRYLLGEKRGEAESDPGYDLGDAIPPVFRTYRYFPSALSGYSLVSSELDYPNVYVLQKLGLKCFVPQTYLSDSPSSLSVIYPLTPKELSVANNILADCPAPPKQGFRALSLGEGWGGFVPVLRSHRIAAFGIDPVYAESGHSNFPEIGKAYLRRHGDYLESGDATNLVGIDSNKFDLVTSHAVYAYIPYPKKLDFLRESFRITKPGGTTRLVLPVESQGLDEKDKTRTIIADTKRLLKNAGLPEESYELILLYGTVSVGLNWPDKSEKSQPRTRRERMRRIRETSLDRTVESSAFERDQLLNLTGLTRDEYFEQFERKCEALSSLETLTVILHKMQPSP